MKMNADMDKGVKDSIYESFKSELKDLLKKYDASIYCESDQDFDKMYVSFFVEKGSRSRDHCLERNLTTYSYVDHESL